MHRSRSVTVPIDETLSTAQKAYDRLKRMIVTVELVPGSSLSEAGIMERLEVGRTPLREALRRLSDEGFVTIYPRRGLVVRQLGLVDAQHVFDSRAVIEPANARAAAGRLDAVSMSRLAAIDVDIQRYEEKGDFMAFMDTDKALHLAIADIAGNRLLFEFTERILSWNCWLWFTHLRRFGVEASDFAPHQHIIDAIYQRDGDAAARAMSQHVEVSRELLRLAL